MRSRWFWITLSLVMLAAAWGGFHWFEERRCRHELAEAKREMASGLNQLARQRLAALVKSRPGSVGAAYQLGLCEEVLGHFDAALGAWTGIPSNDPYAAKAAMGRARVLLNTGRFAPAETLFLSLTHGHGLEAEQARHALQLLFHIEGRSGEVRERSSRAGPIPMTRQACSASFTWWIMQHSQSTTSGRRSQRPTLATTGSGWAKLPRRPGLGHFDEVTGGWLARCTERRPDDQAVWRARLDLARSADDPEMVQLAANHLTPGRFTPAELLELKVWLAARAGELEVERHTLTALIAVEPGSINSWDQLAELALLAGRNSALKGFCKKKAEFNELREHYKKLLDRDDRASMPVSWLNWRKSWAGKPKRGVGH